MATTSAREQKDNTAELGEPQTGSSPRRRTKPAIGLAASSSAAAGTPDKYNESNSRDGRCCGICAPDVDRQTKASHSSSSSASSSSCVLPRAVRRCVRLVHPPCDLMRTVVLLLVRVVPRSRSAGCCRRGGPVLIMRVTKADGALRLSMSLLLRAPAAAESRTAGVGGSRSDAGSDLGASAQRFQHGQQRSCKVPLAAATRHAGRL